MIVCKCLAKLDIGSDVCIHSFKRCWNHLPLPSPHSQAFLINQFSCVRTLVRARLKPDCFGKFSVKPRIVRDNLRIATIKVGRSHTWTAEVIGEPVTTKTWRSEKETSHIENHERITITNEDYSTTFTIKEAMRKVVWMILCLGYWR